MRFRVEDADKYGTQSTGFFSLSNDKDTARVRIMYNDMNDVGLYAVHEIVEGDRRRYVNCLREYNSPMSDCPMCAKGFMQKTKFYIPLYVAGENGGEVKFWERGKKFIAKIASLCSRYPNLVSHIFEIERNGKKGDQTTTYEIYELSRDETRLEDLPEVPDVLGTIILDKTKEEMEDYIRTGSMSEQNAPQEVPQVIRRTPPTRDDEPRRREAF